MSSYAYRLLCTKLSKLLYQELASKCEKPKRKNKVPTTSPIFLINTHYTLKKKICYMIWQASKRMTFSIVLQSYHYSIRLGKKNAVYTTVPAKIYHSYQQDDWSLFSNILMPGGWIIFNIFITILYHEFIPHGWQKNDSEEKTNWELNLVFYNGWTPTEISTHKQTRGNCLL